MLSSSRSGPGPQQYCTNTPEHLCHRSHGHQVYMRSISAYSAQWADKGGQRILVCFHAFSLFFFDKNVTIMSRIDIIIHYSSFENLFTKEKSHFWCILSSWSLNFINNCNLLATSACLMLSGSNTYIKLKPAIYPTPTSPTYIYLISKSPYLINNLLVLFRKASLSLLNLPIPSSHLETFGLVFVPK